MARKICVIPARMSSSRFPNKPMTPILGMPMIGHIVKRCLIERIFDDVVVATCDQEIIDYCKKLDVRAVMTSDKHERATDRVEEAVTIIEALDKKSFDMITMVQGDEPMVTPSMLKLAVSRPVTDEVPILNLIAPIQTAEEYTSPNCVKVVLDLKGHALYFSREAIPSAKKVKQPPSALKQTGMITFQRKYLTHYSKLTPTPLEEIESVDMMRVLEHGFKIACLKTAEESFPVDVPDDVQRVEGALKNCELVKKYLS